MSNIINSITLSNQLQQAKSLMASLTNADGSIMFRNLDKAIIVQNTLRSEILLNNSSTSFQVPVLQNSQFTGTNTTNTSNLLSLQDLQVVTDIGVFVAKPSSATDGGYQVFPYAPTSVFSTANTASSIIGMFNNGYLKFTNNQQVVAPYWDLLKHYCASRTQPATNADYTASAINYISSIDGSTDGFYPCQPMWVFNGAGNVQVTLNLPVNMADVETNSRIIIMWRGYLLMNASQIK